MSPISPTSSHGSRTPVSSAAVQPTSSTPASSGQSSTNSNSQVCQSSSPDVISKYLVQYVPETPKSRRQTADRVTGSRVLTSAAGLAILKEKEDKKKREAEEKEKRRMEREEKKKEKEAQARMKAEERLKKAAEKRKAPAAARKTSTRKRTASSQPKGRKSKQQKSSTVAGTSPSTSEIVPTPAESAPLACDALSLLSSARAGTGPASHSSNGECCECQRTYAEDVSLGTGAEWVMCACGRWLHEECIDSVEFDDAGKEKFCSFCIV